MPDSIVLGVDIGGSHLTAALVDTTTKSILKGSERRIRVNSSGSAEEILTAWSGVVNDLFGEFNIASKKIGIAMPGPFDYDHGISLIRGLDKYEALYQLNVKNLLADLVFTKPSNIKMMNDAACFLRGEAYYGAGRGFTHLIGITLGTGTGTAIHNHPVTEDANLGPSPFMDSIADEYFSTRWFVKRYEAQSGKKAPDVKTIAGLYETDLHVRQLFSEFAKNLAQFLSGFAKKGHPEAIVLGGNIAQCSDLFLADVTSLLTLTGVTVPIIKAQLSEKAAVLGAATLF